MSETKPNQPNNPHPANSAVRKRIRHQTYLTLVTRKLLTELHLALHIFTAILFNAVLIEGPWGVVLLEAWYEVVPNKNFFSSN